MRKRRQKRKVKQDNLIGHKELFVISSFKRMNYNKNYNLFGITSV